MFLSVRKPYFAKYDKTNFSLLSGELILHLASLGKFSYAVHLCQISSILSQNYNESGGSSSDEANVNNLKELIKEMNLKLDTSAQSEDEGGLGDMTKILVQLSSSLVTFSPESNLSQCICLSRYF